MTTAHDFIRQAVNALRQRTVGTDVGGHLAIIRSIGNDAIFVRDNGRYRIAELTCQLPLGLAVARLDPREDDLYPLFIIRPVLEYLQGPFHMIDFIGIIDHADQKGRIRLFRRRNARRIEPWRYIDKQITEQAAAHADDILEPTNRYLVDKIRRRRAAKHADILHDRHKVGMQSDGRQELGIARRLDNGRLRCEIIARSE